MKNLLVVTAVILAASFAQAAKVGDFAKYSFKSVESGTTTQNIFVQKIISINGDQVEFQNTAVLGNGNVQVTKDVRAKNQFCDSSLMTQTDLETSCAQIGGKMSKVKVQAGEFEACTFKYEMTTTTLGVVPFCVVKTKIMTDHGNVTIELLDYSK